MKTRHKILLPLLGLTLVIVPLIIGNNVSAGNITPGTCINGTQHATSTPTDWKCIISGGATISSGYGEDIYGRFGGPGSSVLRFIAIVDESDTVTALAFRADSVTSLDDIKEPSLNYANLEQVIATHDTSSLSSNFLQEFTNLESLFIIRKLSNDIPHSASSLQTLDLSANTQIKNIDLQGNLDLDSLILPQTDTLTEVRLTHNGFKILDFFSSPQSQ